MNFGYSSEKPGTSSSTTKTTKIPRHVVNLKESKTHLFYVIQSDNESHGPNTQRVVQLKILKESRPTRSLTSQKMRLRYSNNDDVGDENRDRLSRTQIPSRLAGIHKRTDHPSFVVLPEVFSRRRLNSREKVDNKNQSTSENSNETYVIRSKNDMRTWENKTRMPTLFNSLWKRNGTTVDAAYLHGLNNSVGNRKAEGFCECDKAVANRHRNSLNVDEKTGKTVISAQNTSRNFMKKDKSCYMCANMTRIFPPSASKRRTQVQTNDGSESTLNHRGGYTKINFKLVRKCLINGSPNEKTEILDAIRMRMKSSDSDAAIATIEDIVKFDLFGVQCECRSKPLLEDLLWPLTSSYQLQTSIAQFVNALVSYKLGRSYFNNRSIIGMLTWGDIGRDNIDRTMGDNLMGIMMKLSLGRFQRTDMIKNGLVRWLLQHMQEEEFSASTYHLQCMAGLMRNLLRGFNLENFSSTEMQRMIVLLGRYLEHDNAIAKRYICESLLVLFQNANCVTCAKNLNFQKVIQEHANDPATDPARKEHLNAIYRLLNNSPTSTHHSTQKFDSRSDDEPFLDADLEPGGEVDCYPGECLIRDKFTGDGDTQRQDAETADESNADDSHKRDRLITRVFVEHLNCFLPNIENNRIFPLCNSRCADKIKTCSHLGDIQPRKRQPYIPPNSRLSRQKHSTEDSIQGGTTNVGHTKPMMMKSTPSDKQSVSGEEFVPRVSTISHDRTAAKWHHFGGESSDDELATSTSHGGPMKQIFGGHSQRADEGEKIVSQVGYHPDSFQAVDASNAVTMNDEKRSGDQRDRSGKVTNEDRDEARNREDYKRDAESTERVESPTATTSEIHTKETRNRDDLLGKMTSEMKTDAAVGRSGLDSGAKKTSITRDKTEELSEHQDPDVNEIKVDKEGCRQLSHGRFSEVTDDFRQAKSPDAGQKAAFEGTSLSASTVARGVERDEGKYQRTRMVGNEGGQWIHSQSEETLNDLTGDKEKSNRTKVVENVDKDGIDRRFPVRSKEMIVETMTGRQSLLNARSENVLQKTSEDNVKSDGNKTGVRLRVRSEENVKEAKGRGTKLQSSKSTDEKFGLALHARSELHPINTAKRNQNTKLKSVRSDNGNLVEEVVPKDIRATETGNKLNVRSEHLVLKQRGKGEGSSKSTAVHARSMEMLTDTKTKPLRKSKSGVVDVDSSKVTSVRKDQAGTHPLPRTPRSSQRTTSPVRSVEYERTKYQLFKSSSEELLGSTKNQDYAFETTGTSRTKLLNQFVVRSEEFVGRTQSAAFEGERDSLGRINSSGTYQSSKHCVDCRSGSGYVLRARPSQPCDRCAVSLTKYPDFVDALGNQDYHRRVVTRTDDQRIKTDFTNKSDARLSKKTDQGNVTQEQLSESKIGEMSEKTKRNEGRDVAKPSGKQGESSKEALDKKLMQRSLRTDDLDGDAKDSVFKGETIAGNTKTNAPRETAEDVTTDTSTIKEPLADKLSVSGEDDCAENTSSTSGNTKDVAGLSTLKPPVPKEKVNNEDIPGDKSLITRNDNLVFATLIETLKPSSITDHAPMEMNANFESDFRLIPKGTETKKYLLTDDNAVSLMNEAGPSMNKSPKQVDKTDELVGNYEHPASAGSPSSAAPTKEELKPSDCGSDNRDVERKVELIQENLGKLDEASTIEESQLLASDVSKMGSKDGESRTSFGEQESKQLQSATTVDQRDHAVTDSENFLNKSTEGTNKMATANHHDDPNLSTNFSHAIGEAITSQFASSQRIIDLAVTDNGQLNVVSPSNDKKLPEATSDSRLTERAAELHLFPRSNELAGVMESVASNDEVRDTNAFDDSENATKDSTGQMSETGTSEKAEPTETVDLNNQQTLSIDIKLKESTNVDKRSVLKEVEETAVHLQRSLSTASQDDQSFLNVPSLDAKLVESAKGDHSVSPDNQLSGPMNESDKTMEPISSDRKDLPAESIRIVQHDIVTALEGGEIPVSGWLKSGCPEKVADTAEEPLIPVATKGSITETSVQHNSQHPLNESLRQHPMNTTIRPVSFDNVRMMENVHEKTTKSNLLATKSKDASPIRNQKQNENVCVKEQDALVEQGDGKESIRITDTQFIENKSSAVLDDAFVEERDLHYDKQTDDTDIDNKLNLEGVGYCRDGNNIESGSRKIKIVNSTCCRRLLNNDELINRLSEKVLEKLKSKIHQCGPNCKSPCGGLNTFFNAKNDNNLNWE